ncbi:MAG: AmmeMemoRadiSam system radical SAM enzyme [Pseudomonadota bacterium]
MIEALLYTKKDDKGVVCHVCKHFCRIKPGKRGICGVRENQDGQLFFLAYSKVIAASVDPIEKKPIYHLKPGSFSYSIATPGCNFKCDFCQNSDIAHMPQNSNGMIQGREILPEKIVSDAVNAGCESIAYTYTEPTIFFELAIETAKLARKKGLFNIFVTNGYMSGKALEILSNVLDAANVDLKSFDPQFYESFCKAKLEPVKENLRQMKEMGILVEITTLLIPGLNDDSDHINAMACFIANDLGPETPWHISRFHPSYQMTNRPVTSVASLEKAYDAGKAAGLRYVYIGNLAGHASENTHCHVCNKLLVQRHGYQIKNNLTHAMSGVGRCPDCDTMVHGLY